MTPGGDNGASLSTLAVVLSPRGFAVSLLAVAGALSAHWAGTTLAAPADLVDHSYLGTTGAVLTPLFLVALGWLAWRGAGTVGLAHVSVGSLLALQTMVFIAQEAVELTSAGLPVTGFFTEPAIVLGLAAQLPVALLIVALIRVAGRLVAALLEDRSGPRPIEPLYLLSTRWMPSPVPVRVRGPRGPPRSR